MKALPVSVFKNGKYDCTNGGISSRYTSLFVVCDDGYIDIDENNMPENLCKVVKRHLFGRDVYHIEPYGKPKGVGWMMGGNFAHTSDSRFDKMVGGMYGAIAIHDRQESQELYDLLSH